MGAQQVGSGLDNGRYADDAPSLSRLCLCSQYDSSRHENRCISHPLAEDVRKQVLLCKRRRKLGPTTRKTTSPFLATGTIGLSWRMLFGCSCLRFEDYYTPSSDLIQHLLDD